MAVNRKLELFSEGKSYQILNDLQMLYFKSTAHFGLIDT